MAAGLVWLTTERYTAQRDEALRRFGRMLRCWRMRNGWTQYVVAKWAEEAGFHGIAAGNLSNIEHGKAGSLRPSTVFVLSEVNRRLAEGDWGPVKRHDLKDQLKAAQPLVGDDGEVWGPTDFWACSVGLKPVPEEYRQEQDPSPPVSERDAKRLSEEWRKRVHELVLAQDLDPAEALQQISGHAPVQYRKRLRQVLGMPGLSFTPEELVEGWENQWLPQKAIQLWVMQNQQHEET